MQEDRREFIDISPLISSKIAVWPEDIEYQRSVSMCFSKGDHMVLSSINSTLHLGAHADSPLHFGPEGQDIAQRDLNFFYGKCQVIEVSLPANARIYPRDIADVEILAPRVLFKTSSFPDPDRWNGDFNSLSPELLQYLNQTGVITVGIDTPSVDPVDSKDLESHKEILRTDMANLEGLDLRHASAGAYVLIALPLRLKDADASPIRAVLIKENGASNR